MVLEDLDAAGFPVRKSELSLEGMAPCLSWLASFHAKFLNEQPTDLWPIGTYWHLNTRPDELDALDDIALKQAAPHIDSCLNNARFQTILHGDAKVANFCFSADEQSVSGVDFQYVGQGVGMKDLVYFVGSCLDETACERYESEILNTYFNHLKQALQQANNPIDFGALETEWRGLYGRGLGRFSSLY